MKKGAFWCANFDAECSEPYFDIYNHVASGIRLYETTDMQQLSDMPQLS